MHQVKGHAAAVLVSCALMIPTDARAQNLKCPVPGEESAVTMQSFSLLLVARDTGSALMRRGLGIARTDSAPYVVVSDSSICTKVRRAIDAAMHVTSPLSYMVLKAGGVYFAFPHLARQQSWYFVDSTFKLTAVIPW